MAMTIEQWTQMLGWCLVINYAAMAISVLYLVLFGEKGLALHARLFGLQKARVAEISFQYLAAYKVLVLVLNLSPYLALRFIG